MSRTSRKLTGALPMEAEKEPFERIEVAKCAVTFWWNMLGRRMVKEMCVDLSLSSTVRCQLGKDLRNSRAPRAEVKTMCPTLAATQASIMFHSNSMSWGMGEQTRKTL